MKRRFKAKKSNNIIRLIILIVIIYLIFKLIITNLSRFNYSNFNKNIFMIGINNIKINLNKKLNSNNIFYLSLNTHLDNKRYNNSLDLVKTNDNIKNPIIYIYNTHQTEAYDIKFNEAYNISYTTWTASYILRDYLSEHNINAIVENNSVSNYLNNNNLKYNKSYDVSRIFINNRLGEYPSIKYLIDLHRDSLGRDKTTINIDNINYAKIKFVVGLDNKAYEKNLELALRLSDSLGSISSGVIKKGGKGVNGVYNQDISPNMILIEVGGVENNIEEVSMSLKVLSNILEKEIINER